MCLNVRFPTEMEWLRTMLGVDNLLVKRNEQLAQQKKQDECFVRHLDRCPIEISLFLLLSRQKNRQLTEEYNKASTSACLGLLGKHIEIVKDNQDVVEKMIESGDLCGSLKAYLNERKCFTTPE